MNRKEAKQACRQRLRRMRNAIPKEERSRMDAAILQNLMHSEAFQNADTILLFLSCGSEPDTHPILHTAWKMGKQTAVPRCLEHGEMAFYCIRSMEDTVPGAYGIAEPVTDVQPELTERTVCLVPAIAFTSDGKRLGQGGGYYDRFLGKYPWIQKIGICYSCMLQPQLPCESHDQCVQAVVTEKSMEVCHGIEF